MIRCVRRRGDTAGAPAQGGPCRWRRCRQPAAHRFEHVVDRRGDPTALMEQAQLLGGGRPDLGEQAGIEGGPVGNDLGGADPGRAQAGQPTARLRR